MKNDPIVEEIHKGRREHAAKFGFDMEKIAEDIKSREGTDGHPIAELKPRRIKMIPVADTSDHKDASK
jgi:hypothetical protein